MREDVLLGERVYLRRLERRDAVALAEASHLEAETTFHQDGRMPMSILSFEAWIDSLGDDEHVFAIRRREDDALLGTASLRHIDSYHGTGETGMGLIRSEDRGKGLGTEAKNLLLTHAFTVAGLHALRSVVFAGNARSARALEKQGYRLAGRLTAHELAAGGRVGDALVYDITRDDWERASGKKG